MISVNLATNALALLAFVVAFYALIARERKTPYITNYIFPPAALLFLTVLLVLIEQLVQGWQLGFANLLSHGASSTGTVRLTKIDYTLVISANILFYAGAIWIVINIWRLHNRQVNFRDDNLFKNIRFVRWSRYQLSRLSKSRRYEHAPEEITISDLSEPLTKCGLGLPADLGSSQFSTFALTGYSLRESDTMIPDLAATALRKGWMVQYTTCARHPYEWILQLKEVLADTWTKSAQQVAVVDGYTPHFGFTDSTHSLKTAEVEREGVAYVPSPESYAGVHTATAKAFNKLKSKSVNPQVRQKTLLIYEGCRSLVDLESVEQYRVFLRHVLTSERMWGGMVTLFIEPEADQSSLDLFRAYSDKMNIRSQEASDGSAK
jgi:hypothetical protein